MVKNYQILKLPRFQYASALLLSFIVLFNVEVVSAQSFYYEKQRPARLALTQYKQVAVGTFYGPLGTVTEKSLDIADELTSRLFNANTFEVIDRNALVSLLANQKNSDVKLMDESVISQLNKKLKSAFFITGRIQSERVEQKLIETKNGTCPGNYSYYWQVTGEASVQVKIFDVATGSLIYSNPVTIPINVRSKETCEQTQKFDLEPFKERALKALPEEIAKLVIPHLQKIMINFKGPEIVLLKNPFKNLNQAVNFFNVKQNDKALAILKDYANDASLKKALQSKAHYNYALGLYCTGDYKKAKEELNLAMTIDPYDKDIPAMYKMVEEEENLKSIPVKTK